ncbi:HrpB1 family type III secretion system apparatus protein [Acidovorax sp. SUPP3334]|uniref:HrpB1 family type III secretion system apparatus protein n=1 Tax=Acidovorax sp. SUPP3334 TaxID=2920881 RepID=UPI0023DE66C0|nr:HrpB1 family type III secretion system apparatus protein [Acidovorax sp. SUPP3334]GKT20968.1 HrpB1 family type III secretion system apparatus protein [Acidovorax sp. SUPP3334]
MNPQFERKEFVAALIRLVYQVIEKDMPDEASDLLAGIRILRPKLAELDITAGWIAFRRGAYSECLQLVRRFENHPTEWDSAKGMIANCQFLLRDKGWMITLNELEQGNASPFALQLVSALIKHRDRVAGNFQDTAEAQGTAETASAPIFQMPFMFMRA